jgi:hypothetical protein
VGGSVGVNDLSGAGRTGTDAPRNAVSDAQSQSSSSSASGAEGRIRGEAGPAADGNVKGAAESKAQGLKPDEVSRVEGQGSEVKSTGDRVRNPDVKGEVSTRAGVDEQVGSASSVQSKGGEVRSVAGDPSAAATTRASGAGESQVRGHVPDQATSAKGDVDSAASATRDPKQAAESKVRSDVGADVTTKPDPTKK